jgi:hypothetical protein
MQKGLMKSGSSKTGIVTNASLEGACFSFLTLLWISFRKIQKLDGPKNEKLRSS